MKHTNLYKVMVKSDEFTNDVMYFVASTFGVIEEHLASINKVCVSILLVERDVTIL